MNQTSSISKTPITSAVLVSWNRCDLLQKAIQSLLDQNYPSLEIIVVDNGSTDGSLDWLRGQDWIKLIENTQNVGASAARNQGTRIASGQYIIYMDSDAELRSSGALSKLIEYMEANPLTAGAAGIYYTDQALTKLWCWSPCMDWEGYFNPTASMQPTESPQVLSTCFSIYRHEALSEIGGFDEYYFYLYEDGDLSQRILKKGYKLLVDPEVKILHHYADPGRTKQDQLQFHYYTERLRMYFLIKNWGVKRFLISWWHKIRYYNRIRTQFPYLSLLNYLDIYVLRSLLCLLRYSVFIRYR